MVTQVFELEVSPAKAKVGKGREIDDQQKYGVRGQ